MVNTAVSLNLWPKILTAHGKIVQTLPPATRQAMMALVESVGVEPRHLFHLIYVAENFDAMRLSTAVYQQRDPFDHLDVVDLFWETCLAAGLLQNHAGKMQLTEKARSARQQRWHILNEALAGLALLPIDELMQVNELLASVVHEMAVSNTVASAWAFTTRRQLGLRPPVDDLKPLARFIELRMDLGAFRDDAHIAVWRGQQDVSPHAWEILGVTWSQKSVTQDILVEKLARRGFSVQETAVALKYLQKKGWMTKNDDDYCLTEAGQTIRETAEQRTDEIFYRPWSIFTTPKLETLQAQLSNF
jgi:hypothetical protein